MKETVTLDWSGDKIKQRVKIPDMDLTSKDIIDSLDNARNKIDAMKSDEIKLRNNMGALIRDIKSATEFIEKRTIFEDKCLEMQKERLLEIIEQIKEATKAKAEKFTAETIAKDPSAYTDGQIKNMPYVNYQHTLATNPVIAKEISRKIIQMYLFDQPIFRNPFEVLIEEEKQD